MLGKKNNGAAASGQTLNTILYGLAPHSMVATTIHHSSKFHQNLLIENISGSV